MEVATDLAQRKAGKPNMMNLKRYLLGRNDVDKDVCALERMRKMMRVATV